MTIPSPSSSNSVISVSDLTCAYGAKTVLNAVSLYVPRGSVFGLVGENGAGKTTLIKHLLGLLVPKSGAVRLFGGNPVSDPVGILSKIGYLSEYRDLPSWMRVDELMRFTAAFYPAWDFQYAESLREEFQLPPSARIRNLSQGQLAKAGLLTALAHRPELLILDEPSTGLDPVVRKDILEAIIRTISEEGRTVLFSSHLLDEIERVCDQLAMIHDGRVVLHGPLDQVKQSHRRFILRFDAPQATAPKIPKALSVVGSGKEWQVLCGGLENEWTATAVELGARIVEEQTPSLDQIFLARAKGLKTP